MGDLHLIQVKVRAKGEGNCWVRLTQSIREGFLHTWFENKCSWLSKGAKRGKNNTRKAESTVPNKSEVMGKQGKVGTFEG